MVPPIHASPTSGDWLTRARVGFRPTTPHSLAGMRIDPPPSLPWATGVIPEATAAPVPPEEPPVEWSGFQGLRAGPWDAGSVVMAVPNSGTLVRPTTTKPAWRKRPTKAVSWSAVQPSSFRNLVPQW